MDTKEPVTFTFFERVAILQLLMAHDIGGNALDGYQISVRDKVISKDNGLAQMWGMRRRLTCGKT